MDEADIDKLPFRFNMDVAINGDNSEQDPKLSWHYHSKQLMHIKPVGLLKTFSVNNIQTFPAIITKEGTEHTIDDYVVVNIVGKE